MAVNKVVYCGETVIDLTDDTVTPETLAEGITAHDKSGAVITGTMKAASEDLSAVLAEQESLIAELRTTLRGKTESGGGSSEFEESFVTRTLTEYSNPTLTKIGSYAFAGSPLTLLNVPAVTSVGTYAFVGCSGPAEVVFPSLAEAPYNGLREWTGLVKLDLPICTKINSNAFYKCTNLEHLILRANKVCTVSTGTVFTNSKIQNTGYVYVPAELLSGYESATNWVSLGVHFRAIEDYPDICGG